jgi:uncharacterized membrane protein YjgN (DUF898 family)
MSDTGASQDVFKTTADAGAATGAAAGPVERISYEGRAGAVAGIALQNALFNLITLGFYRFWAKTRLRRYFWGNTVYRGERVEYTGRGIELFIGFLIAIAILIVLIFRARRYRLSRSQWRGIRGGQSGSASTFALMAVGWALVSGLTLGLAYPVFRTRLMTYQMDNTWFGSESLGFTGRAGELFGTWFVAWLLLIPTLGLSYVWYRVREFRYFASRSSLGPLSFSSDLHSGRIYLIYLTNLFVWVAVTFLFVAIGYVMLTSGGTLPTAQGTEEQVAQQWMALGAQNPLLIVLLLLYLVASGLIRTVVWLQPMVAQITTSLSVAGEMDFARLAQSWQEMPGRGEGLAEALDVGSI